MIDEENCARCGLFHIPATAICPTETKVKLSVKAYEEGYAQAIEDAAKVADKYEDQINGTQDFRNGWRQSAESIESAIKSLLLRGSR